MWEVVYYYYYEFLPCHSHSFKVSRSMLSFLDPDPEHAHTTFSVSAIPVGVTDRCIRSSPGPGISDEEKGVSCSWQMWQFREGTHGSWWAPGWSGMVGSCTYRVVSLESGSLVVAWNFVITVVL